VNLPAGCRSTEGISSRHVALSSGAGVGRTRMCRPDRKRYTSRALPSEPGETSRTIIEDLGGRGLGCRCGAGRGAGRWAGAWARAGRWARGRDTACGARVRERAACDWYELPVVAVQVKGRLQDSVRLPIPDLGVGRCSLKASKSSGTPRSSAAPSVSASACSSAGCAGQAWPTPGAGAPERWWRWNRRRRPHPSSTADQAKTCTSGTHRHDRRTHPVIKRRCRDRRPEPGDQPE